MDWSDYQRDSGSYTPKTGKQRCVITSAEEAISKASGKPMIIVTVRPSGSKAEIKTYIVKNDNFNRNMTSFFDAFPTITEGDFNFLTWIGAEGAAEFGTEKSDRDGKEYLRVKWFISADKAKDLPPFEGSKPVQQEFTSLDDSEEDLPFM